MIFEQGSPGLGFDFGKEYINKGEKLGGFIAPFNLYGSTRSIFYRFGLWNNKNGVCVDGKKHIPIRGGHYTFLTEEPVMCGDYVWEKQVLKCESNYIHRTGLWENFVLEWGRPELKGYKEYENQAINEIADRIIAIANKQLEITENIFKNALPLCVCPPNGNLNVTPAIAAVEALKKEMSSEIEKARTGIDEKKWH